MELLPSTSIVEANKFIDEAHGTTHFGRRSRDSFRALFWSSRLAELERFFPPEEAAYFREWLQREVEGAKAAMEFVLESIKRPTSTETEQ